MFLKCALLLVSAAIGLLVMPTYSVEEGSGRTRYLLYSVNFGEGFNLRRDVHLRAATLVKKLRETEDWVLVLPPWPRLHHWKSKLKQNNVPWERFFDLPSLNEYVPSIEFNEYLKREGHVINEVGQCVYHVTNVLCVIATQYFNTQPALCLELRKCIEKWVWSW